MIDVDVDANYLNVGAFYVKRNTKPGKYEMVDPDNQSGKVKYRINLPGDFFHPASGQKAYNIKFLYTLMEEEEE